MWASDRIYEYTTYNGYLETEYRLCPYVYIRGSNVSSSDSTWSSSLEISESMINKNTVTGEEDVYHGYNQIYVDNVRISFACGNKTQMLRTFTDGKTKLVNGGDIANGKPLAGRILAKIFDAVPFGKQANEIIGWISDVSKMNTMASEIKLGSEYMTLFSKPTSGLIKTFDKKYIFNKHTEADGHSAITQVILSSSLNENERTTGVIRIMYDVQSYPSAYYDEYLRKDYTVESIFDYSSGSYK